MVSDEFATWYPAIQPYPTTYSICPSDVTPSKITFNGFKSISDHCYIKHSVQYSLYQIFIAFIKRLTSLMLP